MEKGSRRALNGVRARQQWVGASEDEGSLSMWTPSPPKNYQTWSSCHSTAPGMQKHLLPGYRGLEDFQASKSTERNGLS